MKQTQKGTWMSEAFIEKKEREYSEWKEYARKKKKEERAAKRAAKAATNSGRKKWFGLF